MELVLVIVAIIGWCIYALSDEMANLGELLGDWLIYAVDIVPWPAGWATAGIILALLLLWHALLLPIHTIVLVRASDDSDDIQIIKSLALSILLALFDGVALYLISGALESHKAEWLRLSGDLMTRGWSDAGRGWATVGVFVVGRLIMLPVLDGIMNSNNHLNSDDCFVMRFIPDGFIRLPAFVGVAIVYCDWPFGLFATTAFIISSFFMDPIGFLLARRQILNA